MTGIKNRNVRFYEEKDTDMRAWKILHSPEIEEFRSQNEFIICAINDFYDRHLAVKNDAYLETREKEDAFADRIIRIVEQKVLANIPALIGTYVIAGQRVSDTGSIGDSSNSFLRPVTLSAGEEQKQIKPTAEKTQADEPEENEFLDFDLFG